MTAGSIPAAGASGTAVLDVERFEWSSPDQLELHGRWYGVRGLRFVRPTLMLRAEGVSRRVLATLEHKPWAALDGEPWVAAFPWQGEPLEFESVELAVTSAVVLELEPPRVPGSARRKKASGGDGKSRALLQEREQARQERDAAMDAREAALRERDEALETRNAAIAQSGAAAQAQLERLRDEAAAARSEAEKLRAGSDEQREALAHERDHARQVARELHGRLKSTETALQEAARERDELLAHAAGGARPDVEAVVQERDELRSWLDRLGRERDELRTRLEREAREREELRARIEAPDTAAVIAAREYRERFEAAQAALDAARAEIAEYQQAPAAAVAPSAPRPTVSGPPAWAARLLALGALAVLIVVLMVLVRSVG